MKLTFNKFIILLLGIIVIILALLFLKFFRKNNDFLLFDYQLIDAQPNSYFYLDSSGDYLFVFDGKSAKLFSTVEEAPILLKTLPMDDYGDYPHSIVDTNNMLYFVTDTSVYKMDPDNFVNYSFITTTCVDDIVPVWGSTIIAVKDLNGHYDTSLLMIKGTTPDNYIKYTCVDSYKKFQEFERRSDITTQIWEEAEYVLSKDKVASESKLVSIASKPTFCFSDWCPSQITLTLFGKKLRFNEDSSSGIPKLAMSQKIIDYRGCIPITLPRLHVGLKDIPRGLYRICPKENLN